MSQFLIYLLSSHTSIGKLFIVCFSKLYEHLLPLCKFFNSIRNSNNSGTNHFEDLETHFQKRILMFFILQHPIVDLANFLIYYKDMEGWNWHIPKIEKKNVTCILWIMTWKAEINFVTWTMGSKSLKSRIQFSL